MTRLNASAVGSPSLARSVIERPMPLSTALPSMPALDSPPIRAAESPRPRPSSDSTPDCVERRPVRSFIEVPVACETRKMSSSAPGVSSAVTLKPFERARRVLDVDVLAEHSAGLEHLAGHGVEDRAGEAEVGIEVGDGGAHIGEVSGDLAWRCPSRVSCIPVSASPVAPVPMRISLSMSVAAAPMSYSALPTRAPAARAAAPRPVTARPALPIEPIASLASPMILTARIADLPAMMLLAFLVDQV